MANAYFIGTSTVRRFNGESSSVLETAIFTLIGIADSLVFCPEGTAVISATTGAWSPIEKDVIAEIRALRALSGSDSSAVLLKSPARVVRHFILASHGNVQLRFATIARELGVEMRTLERTFFDEYHQTMAECQTETRLAFSQSLLRIFPPTKISAVAAVLGYNVVRDFNRFFKKRMHESPSEWSRRERAIIARKER
jgi:AraC-like DNA-binding protein